jgi:hypothetical protein
VSKKSLINFDVITNRKAKKKFSATLFTRPSFVALGLKVIIRQFISFIAAFSILFEELAASVYL